MKQEEKKPREFWVYKGTSNFYDELKLDDSCENYIRNKPEGFYDIVSEKDTIEGAIKVIEYSAYEQLKTENERLRAAVDYQIKKYAELDMNPSDFQVIEMLGDRIDELKAKLEKAKEALRFYVQPRRGAFLGSDSDYEFYPNHDVALDALKEIELEK